MAKAANVSAISPLLNETTPTASVAARTSLQSTNLLEQPVQFCQSLELVQTIVCAVVSTVTSLRRLFPENCFKVHYFDVNDPSFSYKDFMGNIGNAAKAGPAARKGDYRYVPWDILVRGSNSGVNKLLDWMELGVADALSNKYLASLQLSIYDSEVSHSNRVEAYIMTFTYLEDKINLELQLSGIRGLPLPPDKTMSNAKQELRFLIHRLTNHIGGFPELPSQSIVNMHFTYNNSCPPNYQPPGFVTCQDHGLILQDSESASVGAIEPGPHRVFVNNCRFQELSSLNTLTIVTLRSPTSTLRRNKSLSSNPSVAVNTEAMQAVTDFPASVRLNPTPFQYRRDSNNSESTSIPDTQERNQLTAIAAMARLRPIENDLLDTQIIDPGLYHKAERCDSVDLDNDGQTIEGSSTQGTPSTVGDRRSARQLALRSAANPPKETLARLKPRKRQSPSAGKEQAPKLYKMSKACSPFTSMPVKE